MARPADDPRVVRADVWLCPLPLAHELHLGAITYRTRDYVVLRLTDETGRHGDAVGYTRSGPLFAGTEMLCEQLGDLPADPAAAHRLLARRFAPGWASLVRAASLIDIALWDLAAQHRGVTVAEALGHEPRSSPAMAVAGYFSDQRSRTEMLEEMQRFVAEGYSTLKLILPGADQAADLKLLGEVRAQTPDDVAIAVDFHGSFTTVSEAVEHCRVLQDLGLRFIEDPFPSADWHEVTEFAHLSPTPVAGGEDLPGLTGLTDLTGNGVGYLRADATASGGYSVVREAARRAQADGARLAPHVWPHVHAHLTAGAAEGTPVEVIPDYVGADPLWTLLADPAPMKGGRWHLPERPGLGLGLDLDAVEARSCAHSTWTLPTGGEQS